MTVYLADTGVFVRCGGPDNEKHRRLRRSLRRANAELIVPRRVAAELGVDPDLEAYPSVDGTFSTGVDEGWIVVADELPYADPLVSTVMDQARRFIATETGRSEDVVEKADTALVGLAAHLLESGDATSVVVLTTDKPAGRAAERILANHGLGDRIEFRYASERFLQTASSSDFR